MNMNPSIFNFNQHGVRIVLDDGKEPWFCLTDVYKSLDISRTSRLFRELDSKGVADCHILTNGGTQKLKFINEPNLYRIIFRSNKPQALSFQDWVFAEVLPKTIAALYPEKVAFPSSFLLAPLQIIMMPLVWLLNMITRILMRMVGIKTDTVISAALTKDELRTIVNESRSKISQRNQDMLLSILDLENVSVNDIMVPRNEIVGIDINDDWKSIVRQLTHSPHGRIVLYRDSLDDAISMLRVREAWRLMAEKKEFTKETMLRAADEIYYVPEGTPLSTQLIKFQRNKKKVGLVVNEYGDIQGLVTVEDILEEIVGDFTTSMSPTLAEEVTPQNDGSVIIDGSANVREINKAFNWHLPEDDARTVNGIILEALEEIPVAGTRVRIGQYDIDILDVQDNMIKQVQVLPVKPLRESVSDQ